ncbi:MAG: hypothetical protein SOV16_02455 [Anaerobiospirillum succiniciproducens]|uniref:hypothetical protein n=1 Tax=Anaerobiospirillum succiniciproducens TaxID=13335 RepID=UPI002A750E25|nr:hypothetical protein [Anaerobiospirillum succiniciproducens]MDY2798024.1 hypothetical protein [Anaerobiospirillum succiniciproducens]
MQPVLPLIKQAVDLGVAYLVTYKSEWIPAVKNGKGEIVKRAHCRTYDRRIVGSIRGNGRSGYVGFREWFFQDHHTELKDYVVFRNADASYSFEKKTDSITHKEMQPVAKGDVKSNTIPARESQQSSYVAKLLCSKAYRTAIELRLGVLQARPLILDASDQATVYHLLESITQVSLLRPWSLWMLC